MRIFRFEGDEVKDVLLFDDTLAICTIEDVSVMMKNRNNYNKLKSSMTKFDYVVVHKNMVCPMLHDETKTKYSINKAFVKRFDKGLVFKI